MTFKSRKTGSFKLFLENKIESNKNYFILYHLVDELTLLTIASVILI